MTFKHIKFEESPIMRSLEQVAIDKGMFNDTELEKMVKKASESGPSYSPTGDVYADLIRLANGLRDRGFTAEANSLEDKVFIHKQAETHLYRAIDEDGEDLLGFAHPDGDVEVAPSSGGHGIAETLEGTHKKMLDVVNKTPTGKFASITEKNQLDKFGYNLALPLANAIIEPLIPPYGEYPEPSTKTPGNLLLKRVREIAVQTLGKYALRIKQDAREFFSGRKMQNRFIATMYKNFVDMIKNDVVDVITGVIPAQAAKELKSNQQPNKIALEVMAALDKQFDPWYRAAFNQTSEDLRKWKEEPRKEERREVRNKLAQTQVTNKAIKKQSDNSESIVDWIVNETKLNKVKYPNGVSKPIRFNDSDIEYSIERVLSELSDNQKIYYYTMYKPIYRRELYKYISKLVKEPNANKESSFSMFMGGFSYVMKTAIEKEIKRLQKIKDLQEDLEGESPRDDAGPKKVPKEYTGASLIVRQTAIALGLEKVAISHKEAVKWLLSGKDWTELAEEVVDRISQEYKNIDDFTWGSTSATNGMAYFLENYMPYLVNVVGKNPKQFWDFYRESMVKNSHLGAVENDYVGDPDLNIKPVHNHVMKNMPKIDFIEGRGKQVKDVARKQMVVGEDSLYLLNTRLNKNLEILKQIKAQTNNSNFDIYISNLTEGINRLKSIKEEKYAKLSMMNKLKVFKKVVSLAFPKWKNIINGLTKFDEINKKVLSQIELANKYYKKVHKSSNNNQTISKSAQLPDPSSPSLKKRKTNTGIQTDPKRNPQVVFMQKNLGDLARALQKNYKDKVSDKDIADVGNTGHGPFGENVDGRWGGATVRALRIAQRLQKKHFPEAGTINAGHSGLMNNQQQADNLAKANNVVIKKMITAAGGKAKDKPGKKKIIELDRIPPGPFTFSDPFPGGPITLPDSKGLLNKDLSSIMAAYKFGMENNMIQPDTRTIKGETDGFGTSYTYEVEGLQAKIWAQFIHWFKARSSALYAMDRTPKNQLYKRLASNLFNRMRVLIRVQSAKQGRGKKQKVQVKDEGIFWKDPIMRTVEIDVGEDVFITLDAVRQFEKGRGSLRDSQRRTGPYTDEEKDRAIRGLSREDIAEINRLLRKGDKTEAVAILTRVLEEGRSAGPLTPEQQEEENQRKKFSRLPPIWQKIVLRDSAWWGDKMPPDSFDLDEFDDLNVNTLVSEASRYKDLNFKMFPQFNQWLQFQAISQAVDQNGRRYFPTNSLRWTGTNYLSNGKPLSTNIRAFDVVKKKLKEVGKVYLPYIATLIFLGTFKRKLRDVYVEWLNSAPPEVLRKYEDRVRRYYNEWARILDNKKEQVRSGTTLPFPR
jgi:hypothetical protein